MKTNKAFKSMSSINSRKPRPSVSNRPTSVQPLPRSDYSEDSLSSITTTDDSEIYVGERKNVKVSKKKPKWLKTMVFKNLFKRKKHVVRNKSCTDSNKAKKIGKTRRTYQSKKEIIPSPSQSSFTSNESDTNTCISNDCESDQTVTEIEEEKYHPRKNAKEESMTDDTNSLKEKDQPVGKTFSDSTSSKASRTHGRFRPISKSVPKHTLIRQSSTERTSTCDSFKSIPQNCIIASKLPQQMPDEKNYYQHKKQSAKAPFQKGLQSSVSIVNNDVPEFNSAAVPCGFISSNTYLSNAENNLKFLTPPASPFWLQSMKQTKRNEEVCEPHLANKPFPFATTPPISSNAGSKRSTPRSRRKRRQRPQKNILNKSLMTVPTNRKEESAASLNRAHYLVVEVVYHGRSLEAKEKAMIQTQVAQLVDELLKKPSSQPTAAPRTHTKTEAAKTREAPVSYKERLDYIHHDSDKFYEAKTSGREKQQRLSIKEKEDGDTEQSDRTTPTPSHNSELINTSLNPYNNNVNENFLQGSDPQYSFQPTDQNSYCPENEFNELVSKSRFGRGRQSKSSASVDYIKYPDLRPAYVDRNPTFEEINKLSGIQTSHTKKEKRNCQPHNNHTNAVNYTNGYEPRGIRPPVPLPRRNFPPHSNSMPKLQTPMSYKEQAQFQSYYNHADILSSPALMSLKGYSSSIQNESPYTTPTGTPAKFSRPLPSPMCYYQTAEVDHAFDADDERFLSPLNASADMKISQTSILGESGAHHRSYRNNMLNLPPPPPHKNSRSATSLSSTRSKKCKQTVVPEEHNAWWMPREWAQERRIGAFGKEWSFEDDEENERQKALKVARNPNVEKIRTCNFIRL